MSLKFSDNIVYRANIFNYDNRFYQEYNSLSESTQKVKVSIKDLMSNNKKEAKNLIQSSIEKLANSKDTTNSLLVIDGIIMSDIELACEVEYIADSVGVNIFSILYRIMEDDKNAFQDYHKEVASHIVSCILVFSSKEEYGVNDFKKIIEWIMSYNNSKDKTRTCLLTTNLYIIMSNDKGLQCFLEVINRGLSELVNIMTREHSINIIYECIFCLWNIANSSKYISLFEKNQDYIFDKLVQVIKLNKVEKIIRISALCVKVSFFYWK